MENPGENQSLNDAPSEFIALGELMDSEARTSDAPAPTDKSRSDLKTLRKLGYRYCNRCEQIVQPQIMSLRKRPGSFFFPYGFEHPLLSLLMLLGKSSPAQPKKIWGCPHCGRDYRRLKRVEKRHFKPPEVRPKGIPRRFLISMISVPVVAFCVCMYALLPKSDMGRPLSRTPPDSPIPIPGEPQALSPDAPDKVPAPYGPRAEPGRRPPQVVPNASQRPWLPPDEGNGQGMRDKINPGEPRHAPGGTEFFRVAASGRSFAYVINCSGSMATRNALNVAKRELLASLDQLPPGALFSVIFYNLKIWVFTDPSGQYEMMPASVENKTFVRSQLKTVVLNGKSADLLALQIALDLKPDVVFFLTPADLMTKNQVDAILPQAGRTRIHVIELGPGPDPGTVSQRSRLATVTRGTYRYIDVTKFPMPASGK